MTFNLKATSSKSFTRVPPGPHVAVSNCIADLGVQPSDLYSPKPQIFFRFEIPSVRTTDHNSPATVWRIFNASLRPKAALRAFVEAWLGRAFGSDKEAERFDVETLLAKPAILTVSETHRNDRVYANIDDIGPLPPSTPAPIPEMEPILYAGKHTAGFPKLPEWVRAKIIGQLRDSSPKPP